MHVCVYERGVGGGGEWMGMCGCARKRFGMCTCVCRGGGGTTECMSVHECGLVRVSGWGTGREEWGGGGGHECVLARTCACVCVCVCVCVV